MESNSGSSWAKWDLHIHSQYSLETNCKLDIKNIFDSAIKTNIEVIAITEHSNFDSLDEIWDLWENGTYTYPDLSKKPYRELIQFIPGIEMKGECGKRGVHFIALFPKEIFIGTIGHKTDKQFLSENFLAKLGCSRAEILKAGDSDYARGLLVKSVNFETAAKLTRDLNGLIIVHNGNKDHGFDRELSHASGKADELELLNTLGEAKERMMTLSVDICEFPNTNDAHKKEADFYWKTFRKPSLIFSDSHDFYDGSKYTWIKGEKNIEGLRQTMFEKTRYCWMDKEPLYPINKIKFIEIDFPGKLMYKKESFCFSGLKETIHFSPYFTCLIGGRGTGKSSLLNLIHDATNENDKILDLTLDGKWFDISEHVKMESNSTKIEYLSQNEIEDFAKDKQKLTDAIFGRLESLYYDSIDASHSILRNNIEEINTHLQDQIDYYVLKNDLVKKEKELSEKKGIIESFSSEDYKRISSEIQTRNESLQQKITSKAKFEKVIESIKQIIKDNTDLKVVNSYDNALNETIIGLQSLIKKYDSLYFDVINKEISADQDEITKLQAELIKYLAKRGLSQENMADVTRASSEIAKIENQISDLKIEISDLKKIIESFVLDSKLKNCEDYKKTIEKLVKNINTEKLEIIESEYVKAIKIEYDFNIFNCQVEIFTQFKIRFESIITPYKEKDNFDDSKLKEILLTCYSIEDTKVEFLKKVDAYDTLSKAKGFIQSLFKNDKYFEFFKLIALAEYYNFEKYKLIKVTYDGKEVQNTSFGQRCTAALVIILSIGNNPIIIDEPEAHLDSALISNYLVDLIKQSKRHRQIIFATHNANFVINGDSELVHILTISSSNQTEINPTTIENLQTRDKLIALEGAIDAFKRREEKYGI